jgi:hypothetical protein
MSEFTSEGQIPFPNLYDDNRDVGGYSELTDEVLDYKLRQYGHFLTYDVMPRAREQADRVIMHLGFETVWRSGAFSKEA